MARHGVGFRKSPGGQPSLTSALCGGDVTIPGHRFLRQGNQDANGCNNEPSIKETGALGIHFDRTEWEPYHDLSKQPGFEPDKWKGRFLTLLGTGSTSWPLLEQ